MRYLPFPGPEFQVCGLSWFAESSPRLWRFPARFKKELPPDIFAAGKQTAGVRIRFCADTGSLRLRAKYPQYAPGNNLSQFSAQGIAAYINGRCWSARVPPMKGGAREMVLFEKAPKEMRPICLYLPLYGEIEILEIAVDADTTFAKPPAFANRDPVVFYGTSITQGGCASRPGLSYQGILGRKYNLDYLNFGFSGKGRCDTEVAEVISQVPAACFVVDVGQNTTAAQLRERFPPFVDILRKAQPQIPVLATTPIFYNAELWSKEIFEVNKRRRAIIKNAIEARRRLGDSQVYCLGYKDYYGGDFTDGSVDGGHPNDLGFAIMAENLGDPLMELLAPQLLMRKRATRPGVSGRREVPRGRCGRRRRPQ